MRERGDWSSTDQPVCSVRHEPGSTVAPPVQLGTARLVRSGASGGSGASPPPSPGSARHVVTEVDWLVAWRFDRISLAETSSDGQRKKKAPRPAKIAKRGAFFSAGGIRSLGFDAVLARGPTDFPYPCRNGPDSGASEFSKLQSRPATPRPIRRRRTADRRLSAGVPPESIRVRD
jgi:hypothetical protein